MQKHGASFFVFSGKPFHCNTKGVSKYLQFKVGNQPLTGLYAADRHLTHLQTTELHFNCKLLLREASVQPSLSYSLSRYIALLPIEGIEPHTATTFLMCLIIFRILTIPPCCDMLIKKMIKH